jgi:hypothetical protein
MKLGKLPHNCHSATELARWEGPELRITENELQDLTANAQQDQPDQSDQQLSSET